MRDRAVVVSYALALVTFAVLAVVVLRDFARFGEQSRWVHHTQEVLRRLEQLLGDLRDVETGQRGFLIAGDEQFLEPYESAAGVATERLNDALALTSDNPAQQRRIGDLRGLIDQKLAFSAQTVATFRTGDHEAAYQQVKSRRGKQLMDTIRRRIDELTAEERRLLELRSQAAETTAWRTNVVIVVGNAFGFVFLASGTLLLGRELNRRRRIEQDRSFAGERHRLEAAATIAQRRLETVVSEMPVGVLLVEPSGTVVLENGAMREAYGGPLPSVEGGWSVNFAQSDGTPYAENAHPLARSLHRGETIRGDELQLLRADRTMCPLIASTAPVREQNGRVIAAVGVFLNAAEAQREQERRREMDRFRDVFLGALGHDLRNPLSVITAGAASLTRHTTNAAEAKIAARMVSSADRMARMITQLIDLVQARLGGGIPLQPGPADLRHIVRTVVEPLELRYPERQVDLVESGELIGEWDAARLGDAVYALVVNALEHGRHNGPVRIVLQENDDRATLDVHNWGNPIPAELVPLIFDPFRRADERRRLKSVGLGLGLYLALQIVRAHNGSIEVTSSAEAGTRFRVRLPRTHA
jgi:signal transduction histidine kinase